MMGGGRQGLPRETARPICGSRAALPEQTVAMGQSKGNLGN